MQAMQTMLSNLLPLAGDPFPPTHKAGSDFEGFFFRLQSHSGRTASQLKAASIWNRNDEVGSTKDIRTNNGIRETAVSSAINLSASGSSPSRIPRLVGRNANNTGSKSQDATTDANRNRADSSSSSSPPSPTPSPSRSTPSTSKPEPLMLTASQQPVFDSPDSFVPPIPSSSSSPSALLFHPNFNPGTTASEGQAQHRTQLPLPSNSPGDLILVICQLETAPIDQRICIYLRWIVHGEEEAQQRQSDPSHHPDFQSASTSVQRRRGSKRPPNAIKSSSDDGVEKQTKGESFEIITYIPSWKVKLLESSGSKDVQPFRIDLPDPQNYGKSLGYMQVNADGNCVVDITVPRASNVSPSSRKNARDGSDGGGTRVRIRTNQHVPWTSSPSASAKGKGKCKASFWDDIQSKLWPIGSQGPEGLLQHVGLLLPLHWYVHTSRAPATFSLENVSLPHHSASMDARAERTGKNGELSNLLPIAAGRATLHMEKNWGHGFPTGWVWGQASTPLPDPGQMVPESPKSQPQIPSSSSLEVDAEPPPEIKVMFAGGSILGMTAFLVGVRVHYPPSPQGAFTQISKAKTREKMRDVEWNFRPPISGVGPGVSFSSPHSPGQRVHYGLGLKLTRDFANKTVELQVWDTSRWAIINMHADPSTFGTKIPGPTKEHGWSPDYCHHSYRAEATITLFERRWTDLPKTAFGCVRYPGRTWGAVKTLLAPTKIKDDGHSANTAQSDAWKHTLGWTQIAHHHIPDRVALEFGGNFAA